MATTSSSSANAWASAAVFITLLVCITYGAVSCRNDVNCAYPGVASQTVHPNGAIETVCKPS